MRHIPGTKYSGFPCSYVGTGCAYEDIYGVGFEGNLPEGLKEDGWSTLENTNRYVRALLPVRKKVYYRRNERFLLSEFLEKNTEKCLVCVYGHFLYASGQDYWSFFDNMADPVVCVWYLEA